MLHVLPPHHMQCSEYKVATHNLVFLLRHCKLLAVCTVKCGTYHDYTSRSIIFIHLHIANISYFVLNYTYVLRNFYVPNFFCFYIVTPQAWHRLFSRGLGFFLYCLCQTQSQTTFVTISLRVVVPAIGILGIQDTPQKVTFVQTA